MKVSEYFLATTIALIIMGGLVYMFVFGKTHPAAPQPTKSIETLNKELISKLSESSYICGNQSKVKELTFEFTASGSAYPKIICKD